MIGARPTDDPRDAPAAGAGRIVAADERSSAHRFISEMRWPKCQHFRYHHTPPQIQAPRTPAFSSNCGYVFKKSVNITTHEKTKVLGIYRGRKGTKQEPSLESLPAAVCLDLDT